jgi:hypothetical protein
MRTRNCVSAFAGLILAAALIMTACGGDGGGGGYTAPSSAKAITAFTVPGAVHSDIDTAKRTIEVVVPLGTGSFTPAISVSGVSVSPASGTAQTLSLPPQDYLYTVTAADGSTAAWTVIVRWEALAPAADVGDYIDDMVGDGYGAAATNPIPLPLAINLSGNGWTDLLSTIAGKDKYIALDLTDCGMGGTVFDPQSGASDVGESKIVTLTLPTAATSIKEGTWWDNPSFEHFTALTELRAFAVETVGVGAFAECPVLETVSLPAAKTIGEYAFYVCTALAKANLPAATSIGDGAFSNCHALATVSLPAVTTIGYAAFAYCYALESASLPAAKTIGEYAFAGCNALDNMKCLP